MDMTQLTADLGRFVNIALEWARSPQFYAQAGLVASAVVLAWLVAGFIKSRVAPERDDGTTGNSAPVKRQLHHVRSLIFPLLLIPVWIVAVSVVLLTRDNPPEEVAD